VKKLAGYFLEGLVYIAPLGVTIYIIWLAFAFVDGLLENYIMSVFNFPVPGLGFLIVFLIIALLGFVGRSILAKPVIHIMEKIINRTPFVKLIYTSIKDLLSAFVGKEKKFSEPVLVRVNHLTNLEKLGFLTQHDLSHLQLKDKVAVYFPHSYNFSGELFIVPSDQVTPLDLPPSEVMKFIVSGGVTRV
jgi:uncharacterized membrane protein